MNRRVTHQIHKGYGKVILFGEHFVVHGAKAVVATLAQYTSCALTLEEGIITPGGRDGNSVVGVGLCPPVDRRKYTTPMNSTKVTLQRQSHDIVLKHLGIDLSTSRLTATLEGDLVCGGGVGASACDVVAFARALNELYSLKLSDEQINEAALEGEKAAHGTPSGIDNTAATYGGILVYQRLPEKGPVFEKLIEKGMLTKPLYLVVVSTGITTSTVETIASVRALRAADEAKFLSILQEYETVLQDGIQSLKQGSLAQLGEAMNRNHTLCQAIAVSCTELDVIVERAKAMEGLCLGAKMSGTGRGGIAIALCSDERSQHRVAEELRKLPEAKFVWEYSV